MNRLVVHITCLLLLCGYVSYSLAFIRYKPRACIDCHGRYARPGSVYYDGCNMCMCFSWTSMFAMCTRRYCELNDCFRSYKLNYR